MEDSGLVRLKYDYYKHNFSETLRNVKKSESYSDVTISCDGIFYRVHRLILSMSSAYLDKLFQNVEKCDSFKSNLVVVLNDIKSKELEYLLDFIYAGEVQVLQIDLPELIKAAEYLGIKGFSKSKESDIINSNNLNSSEVHERPNRTKRTHEDNEESENIKKFRDDRNESNVTENISFHDTDKTQSSKQENSPICDNEDSTHFSNDAINEEITEIIPDVEIGSHESFTKENSESSELNDPLDFEKVKRDNEDDSNDIFIEEDTISTPTIVPHFKPMDSQAAMLPNTLLLTNTIQNNLNNISLPGTSRLHWMDFDGGQSIEADISNSSNIGAAHSYVPTSMNTSPTKRNRGSPAWIGFDEIGPGNEGGSKLVKCKLCGIVKVSKGGNTTIMVQHIKVHHKNHESGICQKLEELERQERRRKQFQREQFQENLGIQN